MLDIATMDTDDLYWEAQLNLQTPKWKRAHVDDKSLDDSVSTVKMVVSQKKKSALKSSPSAGLVAATKHPPM